MATVAAVMAVTLAATAVAAAVTVVQWRRNVVGRWLLNVLR